MSTEEDQVWLGAPQRAPYSENPLDPLTTKIGGKAVYFRLPSAPPSSIPSAFQCPKCHSTENAVLVSQLFAPLEPFDRVLYVLMCMHCTRPSKPLVLSRAASGPAPANQMTSPSVCFAVRSENFNKHTYQTMLARRAQEEQKRQAKAQAPTAQEGNLFEENMDWGDDGGADDWGDDADGDNTGGEVAAEAEDTFAPPSHDAPDTSDELHFEDQEEHPIAPVGELIPFKTKPFTSGIPLDLFEEPEDPYKKRKAASLEQQLEELETRYGGDVVDSTSVEKDDETPQEKFVRKYMERLEREPSQCVRWCPDGHPLCTSTHTPALAAKAPRCARCGAERRFELQLTAPVVYFLTKEDGGEDKNQFLHFSNIHIFTCSANCSGPDGYIREHVIVEEEI